MTLPSRKPLGPLEHAVMQVIWAKPEVSADDVRIALRPDEHKESTIRTILRRLEEKGYVEHDVDGRTFVYRALIKPQNVASRQVRGLIERFCKGSVEKLLVGMVDDELITPEKLRELADRISKAELPAVAAKQRKKRR